MFSCSHKKPHTPSVPLSSSGSAAGWSCFLNSAQKPPQGEPGDTHNFIYKVNQFYFNKQNAISGQRLKAAVELNQMLSSQLKYDHISRKMWVAACQ